MSISAICYGTEIIFSALKRDSLVRGGEVDLELLKKLEPGSNIEIVNILLLIWIQIQFVVQARKC